MKKTILLSLAIAVIFALVSCVKTSESKKVADDFYAKLSDDNYTAAIDLLSDIALDAQSKKDWKQTFKDRNLYWGTPKSWENTFSEMKSSEIGEVVELRYKVENSEGTTYETIKLHEQDGKMKIVYYCYTDNVDYILSQNENEEDADADADKLQSFPEQEKVINRFYSFYKENDYTELESIVSKTALENSNIEVWTQLLTEKADNYGKIKRRKKIQGETVGSENNEYYILIYEITPDFDTLKHTFLQVPDI